MKRKISSVLIIVILLVIGFCFIIYSKEVMNSVLFSFSIWKNNLVPALFPFFVLSELLIQYGFVDFLGELGKNIMNRYFHLPGQASFVLAMSMVSGFPSGAKYTKSLLDNHIITDSEASRLLTFTHFSNPLFIMGTIAVTFLHNKKLGLLILFCHFVTNFFIGILFRPKHYKSKKEHVSFVSALSKMHQKHLHNEYSFGQILTKAIMGTLETLLLMFGIVTFFLIITTLLQQLLPLSSFEKTIVSGIFEMTQGVKNTSQLGIPILIKAMLITFFLSFGGLSVHMQVNSIICDTKIKYRYFLMARIIHGFLSTFLLFILYQIFF